jgi:citrate synthase
MERSQHSAAQETEMVKPPLVTSHALEVRDGRTGRSYQLPISENTVPAPELRSIKASADDFGLMSYDPGLVNTAVCHSAITFVDGDAGVLLYRGFPIEQLAEKSTYPAVAFLLYYGRLPSQAELASYEASLRERSRVPDELKALLASLPLGSNPMRMLMSAVAALGVFHPQSLHTHNAEQRESDALNLVAQVPALAALAFRRSIDRPFVDPDTALGFVANFRRMLFAGEAFRQDPVLERGLDVLLILHADHEQNCSTSAVRSVASSESDPYSALSAGIAALFGPLHGGANEAVLKMLREIGSVARVPAFMDQVKRGEGRLMGFGHRVYKSYDPRARIVKKTANEVFAVTGVSPLLEIALELERRATADDYFIERKLYPNVDFYSGLIYEAMGLPSEMFPVLFATARTSGWVAQWNEFAGDPHRKLVRPRQIYVGPARRNVP